ncbi:Fe(2+)/2-oxoglutarate-dependent oxygenase fmaF [Aspergillus alliaceus]|uniref:Fe(2+)/2-oxoglutarate-dependent oxygenase fmaF n=1 Tax=Petromyces alliaceus TaxID=209559 RepID=UPI0012A3C02D|nr:uncharacterized protein BDW43DRAFT_308361 [Aspergillus alliaceus]KAB8236683.1 hypothetical protein BDW43DRAFT_308361 [Aspergillus alliaceus]
MAGHCFDAVRQEQPAEAKAKFKQDGWAVVPNIIDDTKAKEVVDRLWKAKEESERRGDPTYLDWLDPNSSNVLIFYLMELDSIFRELIAHPVAVEMVQSALGQTFLISNYTANIALPRTKSMGLYSDLSLQCPDPWLSTWRLNVVWCLHDMYRSR